MANPEPNESILLRQLMNEVVRQGHEVRKLKAKQKEMAANQSIIPDDRPDLIGPQSGTLGYLNERRGKPWRCHLGEQCCGKPLRCTTGGICR